MIMALPIYSIGSLAVSPGYVRGNLPVFMATHTRNLAVPLHGNGVSQRLF